MYLFTKPLFVCLGLFASSYRCLIKNANPVTKPATK